jgi:hypothetical protein
MTTEHKRCIYTRLDNGIHEFIFTESSRDAVDELAAYIRNILDTTPADAPPTCYMVDVLPVERRGVWQFCTRG